MKSFISKLIQIILFIIGIPFFLVDIMWKNKKCEWVIEKINIACYRVNWWGKK